MILSSDRIIYCYYSSKSCSPYYCQIVQIQNSIWSCSFTKYYCFYYINYSSPANFSQQSNHLLYTIYLSPRLVYPNILPYIILIFTLFFLISISHLNYTLIISILFISLFSHYFECLFLFILIVSFIVLICTFVMRFMGR